MNALRTPLRDDRIAAHMRMLCALRAVFGSDMKHATDTLSCMFGCPPVHATLVFVDDTREYWKLEPAPHWPDYVGDATLTFDECYAKAIDYYIKCLENDHVS